MTAQTNRIVGVFNPNSGIFETADRTFWIDRFDGNYARISKNGFMGLIDRDGKIVLDVLYNRVIEIDSMFIKVVSDGRFLCLERIEENKFTPENCEVVSYEWRQGTPDKMHRRAMTMPPIDELLLIKRRNFRERAWSEVRMYDNTVIPLEYNNLQTEVFNRLLVKKDNKWGVVNYKNEIIVPFIYSKLVQTQTGFIAVKNDKYGFIDLVGNERTSFTYSSMVQTRSGFIVVENGKYAFIDLTGMKYFFGSEQTEDFSILKLINVERTHIE